MCLRLESGCPVFFRYLYCHTLLVLSGTRRWFESYFSEIFQRFFQIFFIFFDVFSDIFRFFFHFLIGLKPPIRPRSLPADPQFLLVDLPNDPGGLGVEVRPGMPDARGIISTSY